MKGKRLIALMLTASITANVYAAPSKPPPGPQDVNVVNTPNVTVTNPQTSVTVDNASINPVPVTGNVTVGNTSPIPVDVQKQASSSSMQLVGFTSGTYTGGLGLLEFARLCQQEFPGSRMCTTKEVADSANIPTGIPTGNAWVRPLILRGDLVYDLTTGFSTTQSANMTCRFWTDNATYNGMVVSHTGGFGSIGCDINNHIACCAAN